MRTRIWTHFLASLLLCLAAAGAAAQPQDVYQGMLNAYAATLPPSMNEPGLVEDWSSHHMIYSEPNPSSALSAAVAREPRYWLQELRRFWSQGATADVTPSVASRLQRGRVRRGRLRRDWSYALGVMATAGDGFFPAKFSFSGITASCTADFVVFNTSLAGSVGAQPNLVAFTNIYSGCGGTVPSVAWGYATGSGTVGTSVTLSLDGTKVAFIENLSSGAILRLLKWKNGEGSFNTATAAWAAAAVDNVTLTSWANCSAGQSCLISLPLSGNPQSTNSPPFYDFTNDALYVGDNAGVLHKFAGVFNGTPAEVKSGFPLTVDAGVTLTGPSYDSVSGNIFVGDSVGKLWYVRDNSSTIGACAANSPPCLGTPSIDVGSGSTQPLIDGPLVDPSTQHVFAFIGCSLSSGGSCTNGGAVAQVVQATTALGNAVRTNLGSGSVDDNLHDGAFDNNYLLSNYTSGHLYTCGNTSRTSNRILYSVGFDASGLMNATATTGPSLTSTAQNLCSPLTEIDNGTTDWLFLSVPNNGNAAIAAGGRGCTGSCVYAYNITSGTLTTGTTAANGLTANSGTSGIIIDNTATTPTGASQIYFSTLTNGGSCTTSGGNGGCAIQVSQSGLN